MVTKLKQMREYVLNELNYIPKKPLPRGKLRAMYLTQRMHSLGKKATSAQSAKEVLEQCISYLKKDYPNFNFRYDKDFFNQQC
ncbi:unnamed protein product [marine sediment metagenome]|uniref:Uncharacterized protein n=1 Tax=marine sediment metagenome TaxID=412755 RepID=X1TXR2_9ZZZZ